ncbi:MAG TPA: tyrosine-protein phosphatase [Bryobacteraceae bacterium]|nr:tyrosine-protein phosphatase [Bryobacteraceae bacterium]
MPFASRLAIALLVLVLPVFAGSAPGIRNFDQVDLHVFRGGQPTEEGFQYLSRLGVKTVVDLREPGNRSKAEAALVTGAGMKYVNVPMTGLAAPSESEIARILALLEDTTAGPVFVHCWRGADRTGAVIAAYHIDHDKWNSARALADARAHSMSFFQIPRENFIRNFRPRAGADRWARAGEVPAALTATGTTGVIH